MPNWTKEQQQAISEEGKNIIVSAGAGSGKTAVLTARVIRKLKEKVSIRNLLILTFTKAAAYEMKERIRKEIMKNEEIRSELDYIDSSYITTFDSFSLSMVKKYHVLLNISEDIEITDPSIIFLEKRECLKQLFDEYYEKEDPNFCDLISTFCLKDDEEIFQAILTIHEKLDLKYDKLDYLNHYMENYFTDEAIKKRISEYCRLAFQIKDEVNQLFTELSYTASSKLYDGMKEVLDPFFASETYEDLKKNCPTHLPTTRGEDEETKQIKEVIKNKLEQLEKNFFYSSREEMKDGLLLSQKYTQTIIELLKEFDHRMETWKKENQFYEFQDVSKLAISLVKNYPEVREELRNYFQEIMVDEYQDTSDLQEDFIRLIEKNNVYMVGDIKQSIYRFRNANPDLFQEKYEKYGAMQGGIKIDLNKNFRSRKEVLDNINFIFNPIMDRRFGQAEYRASHQMIFGNMDYCEKGDPKDNRNLELFTYTKEKDFPFTKEEIEIFTIARDIQKKISSSYLVYDKDLKALRTVKYQDFAILIDRSGSFDKYKKVFEYLHIPLSKYRNTQITQTEDVLLLRNVLQLLEKEKQKNYDVTFEYAYTSVARSFLFSYTDSKILDILSSKTFSDTSVMKKVRELLSYASYDLSTLFEEFLRIFEFYDKLLLIGNMEDHLLRIDYLKNLMTFLAKIGYQIEDACAYFNDLMEQEYKFEVESLDQEADSVKIMTIHTSKGLEFPICYFAGLDKPFNIRDVYDKFYYDPNYGIISPYFKNGVGDTIDKALAKKAYIEKEISEKIRLFYVALTRCKEKMIFVIEDKFLETEEEAKDKVSDEIREKYRSFAHFLKSIAPILKPYEKKLDLNTLALTKDYNIIQSFNYQKYIKPTMEEVVQKEIVIPTLKEEKATYSKKQKDFLTIEEKKKMEYGSKIHELLEYMDFKNPVLPSSVTEEEKSFIEGFLHCGLDFEHAKIYHEYTFFYEEEGKLHNGVIDLVLEYDEEIIIIDYKLKNIQDEAYQKQLKGYEEYIYQKTKKKTKLYLYSILEKRLVEVK